MFDDSLARSHSAAPSGVDADYDAIHATIIASERGRWFLEEHARRHRGADTNLVLTSLDRIERLIRGAIEAETGAPAASPDNIAGELPEDLAAMLKMLQQARSEIVTHHGDPAASGEAAIADFRNAAEQVQELVGGSELGTQLSLPINRLASAADRLERSVGALRMLVEMLDTFEQHLRQRTEAAESSAPAMPAGPVPPAPPLHDVARSRPSVSAAKAVAEPAPVREPMPEPAPLHDDMLVGAPVDEPQQPQSAAAASEVPWNLAVATPDTAAEPEPGPEALSEASLTDWAFAADEIEPEPVAHARRPLPEPEIGATSPLPERPSPLEPPEPPMSALERLEVREYSRQRVSTAVAPPAPEALEPATFALEVLGPEPSAPETDDLGFLSAEPVAPPVPETSAPEAPVPQAAAPEVSAPEADDLGFLSAEPVAPPVPETSAPEAPIPQAATPEVSAPEADDLGFLSTEPTAPPPMQQSGGGGLDDLLVGDAPADDQLGGFEASPVPRETGWADEPPTPQPTANSIFDTDLFETEDAHETGAPRAAEGAAPMNAGLLADDEDVSPRRHLAEPEPEPPAFYDQLADVPERPTAAPTESDSGLLLTESEQPPDRPVWSETVPDTTSRATPDSRPDAAAGDAEPPPYDAETDTPAVLERLESMRRAIAALMSEVNEKAPRRGQPPSAS